PEAVLAEEPSQERPRARRQLPSRDRAPTGAAPQLALAAVDEPEEPRGVERGHVEPAVLPVAAVARPGAVDLQRPQPEIAEVGVQRPDRAQLVQAYQLGARRL